MRQSHLGHRKQDPDLEFRPKLLKNSKGWLPESARQRENTSYISKW